MPMSHLPRGCVGNLQGSSEIAILELPRDCAGSLYRAGFKYIDGGLEVNQQDIKDFGINFGLGIPVGRLSKANLGFEFGQRGTDEFGLIKENYLNFMIGVSLNDLWFIKSMYN